MCADVLSAKPLPSLSRSYSPLKNKPLVSVWDATH